VEGQRRHSNSYDDFVATHRPRALHVAARMTQNTADAEDLCQEVFFKVFRVWERRCNDVKDKGLVANDEAIEDQKAWWFCDDFKDKGVVAAEFAWLCKLLLRKLLDIWRHSRHARTHVSFDAPASTQPGSASLGSLISEPEDVAARRFALLRIRLVREMLSVYPAAWSVTAAGLEYHTHHCDGKTLAEISTQTGVPLGTVNDQTKRVDAAVRQLLKDDEELEVDADFSVGHTITRLEKDLPTDCTARAVLAFKHAYSWKFTRQWEVARKKVRARPENLLDPIAKQFGMDTPRMLDLLCTVRSPFAYRCEDHYEDTVDHVEWFFMASGKDIAFINWRMQLLLAGRSYRIPPHDFPPGHRFRPSTLPPDDAESAGANSGSGPDARKGGAASQ